MSIIKIDQMVIFIFFISIIVVISTNNKIYRIPFGQHNFEYLYQMQNYSTLAEDIFFNVIYINLSIGTPPQKNPFQLDINSQTFFTSKNYFIPNKSNTYESTSNSEKSFYYGDLHKGFISKDYIYIDNIKEKIDFIQATEFKKDNNIGNIGLLIPNKLEKGVYPFFSSLKKAGIIDSYTFTFKYYNDISILDTVYNYGKKGKYIGEFIMGDEPHNYEKNKEIYNESEYLKVTAMNDFNGLFWDIFFNSIYLETKDNGRNEKIKINGNHNAEINPNIGFIIATNEFFRTINQNFFNQYKDICIEKNINNTNFQYIECNKSDIFNISSFPNIYLKSLAFETIFNLTYKDLFIFDEINNKYIFCIINSRYVSNWILGAIFLRKYQFTFNVDSKTFGYYKSMNDKKNTNFDNNDNNNELNKKENQNDEERNKNQDKIIINGNNDNKKEYIIYILIGILFIIFSFLFILLGIFIQRKCLNYRRKKRVNELEDEVNDIDKINNNLINSE